MKFLEKFVIVYFILTVIIAIVALVQNQLNPLAGEKATFGLPLLAGWFFFTVPIFILTLIIGGVTSMIRKSRSKNSNQ